MKTKNTKKILKGVLAIVLTQFLAGTAIAEIIKTAPSTTTKPSVPVTVTANSSKPVNLLSGTGTASFNATMAPKNPVVQYIADICEAARRNPDLCGLVDKTQAQKDCEDQKKEVAKTTQANCDSQSIDNYNKGFQDGEDYLKQRGPGGYIFSPGGRITCENLCAHIKADDGHMMTCIGSITDDSHVGSCDSKDQDCICI